MNVNINHELFELNELENPCDGIKNLKAEKMIITLTPALRFLIPSHLRILFSSYNL